MNLRYDTHHDPRGVDGPTVRHQPVRPAAPRPGARDSASARPGFGAALRYEWTGLRTLRTPWLLAGAALLLQALAAGYAMTKDLSAAQAFDQSFAMTPKLAALFVAAIGVNVFATDYRNRTITTTLLAVRSRTHVVLAKTALTAAVGAVVSLASVAITYVLLLPGDLAMVSTVTAGVLLYVVLSALFGLALAGLTRSSAVALSAVLLVPLLLEVMLVLTLHWDFAAMPFAATAQLFQNPDTASWWMPLPLLGITTALSVAAAVLLSRRDA
ncbi:ABC transporter permease [Saccharopolyspora sp. NFXS83]|uniref:ABC transporter permease n=1 Tax=Saccharopolyspora sp. NFXS83 TaxID=2993560 RepID=UPI00224B851F|nr:ABC transporter permease [Saccharopolyspora sp. NFXS83]MCX2733797.1 ABC transporter permease [Saccharopolyspora sp. NFXS83]